MNLCLFTTTNRLSIGVFYSYLDVSVNYTYHSIKFNKVSINFKHYISTLRDL
jgi:hypothetical protein